MLGPLEMRKRTEKRTGQGGCERDSGRHAHTRACTQKERELESVLVAGICSSYHCRDIGCICCSMRQCDDARARFLALFFLPCFAVAGYGAYREKQEILAELDGQSGAYGCCSSASVCICSLNQGKKKRCMCFAPFCQLCLVFDRTQSLSS